MPDRAAIVTGASRGIGLAIARALAADGYALTLTSRKPEPLAATAAALTESGFDVVHQAANMGDEEAIRAVVALHRERYGRLDVLVNNAGVGIGAGAHEHQTRFVDMMLDVNVRAIILFYRECLEMLKAAGAEHRQAQVVNLASIAGKSPQPWLSVYSATKAAVIAYTAAMNKELAGDGVKSVALCPGFVDTDMTEFIREAVPVEEMIRPSDIADAVRCVLRVSPSCVIPEIIFERPGETL
jgi:NAD(P)-dependent dehydrogenase (short-subunit alcohol dehydrogenase family)